MAFTELTGLLDNLYKDGIPGADFTVYRDHKEIYRHTVGMRDRELGIPMDGTELYWIYSATKLHTCTAALRLVEQGLIGLDDAVSKYLPAFSDITVNDNGVVRPAKTVMTIRHLFAMQGGLDYNLESPSVMAAREKGLGTVGVVNAMAKEPLSFDPGAHFQYSLCHDVLAAVVEVVSGMSFGDYLKRNIWDKLGMKDVGFRLTDDKRARFAKQYEFIPENHTSKPYELGDVNIYELTPSYESGGAGLLCSVDDYILLSDALACGGIGKTGERVLKSETIDLMRSNQQFGQCMIDFNNVRRTGYGYALGVRTLIDDSKSLSPLGEFGWDGAACAYTLIDPLNHISAYLGMQVRNCGYGYDVIHPALRDAIYRGL